MEESQDEHKPKLTELERIGGFVIMAGLDAADIFEAGVPISDALGFAPEQIYLKARGLDGTYALVGNCLEFFLPGIDYLPLRTVAWGMTVWMDLHPDSAIANLVTKAGKKIQTAKNVTDIATKFSNKGKKEIAGTKDGQSNENTTLKAANDNASRFGGGAYERGAYQREDAEQYRFQEPEDQTQEVQAQQRKTRGIDENIDSPEVEPEEKDIAKGKDPEQERLRRELAGEFVDLATENYIGTKILSSIPTNDNTVEEKKHNEYNKEAA